MIKPFLNWLDHRTGSRGLFRAALYEHIPGGARWRYVWGSTLVFVFVIQMLTGLFLWMGYSPSSQTAWESVYYIEHEMIGGWLLRGIHHYMAQAMIVLLALHMAQVIIDGAYRAPREVNFWIGLLLLQVVMGLSLTGYLLPWDQKGYWATQVATNIMGIVPVIGPAMQRVLIGGTDYGHLTLTRFFALHAGLLPFLMIVLIIAHVAIFRRHGITARQPLAGPDASFWPDQVLRDAVACLGVLLAVVILTIWRGAELGAPADPSVPYSAARPEWYFLFLFQFLKLQWFAGENEIYGAVVFPGLVMLVLFLMPLFGRWKIGHLLNTAIFAALLVGIAVLTGMAMVEDRKNPAYQLAAKRAHEESERAIELAQSPAGIPVAGAVALMRGDAFIQGPRLFAQNCASCHRYDENAGMSATIENPTASDLKGFASREWIEGLLDPAKIATPHYFGGTKHKDGKMAEFIKEELGKADDTKKAQIKAVAAALSAEAKLKSQRDLDARDAQLIKQGQEFLKTSAGCSDCHTFHGEGEAIGPDLTDYGSRQWLTDFISDPSHKRFYGTKNDRMPSYGTKQILDPSQIRLIVDWLRGEWYVKGDSVTPSPTTRD